MGVSVADFVDVSARPDVHIIADTDIPELWTGDKGGSARLLAGSGGPDMLELWLWECGQAKSLNHRAYLRHAGATAR